MMDHPCALCKKPTGASYITYCQSCNRLSLDERLAYKETPGYRADSGKPQYGLIPSDALEGLAKVLTFGANRYSPRNWEQGMAWSRCFNSMMRHAWAYWRGEDLDPESGLPHVDHMVCNAMFLAAYFKRPDLRIHDDRERLNTRDERALHYDHVQEKP